VKKQQILIHLFHHVSRVEEIIEQATLTNNISYSSTIMIKFTHSTKKKIDKVRSGGSSVAAPADDGSSKNANGGSPQQRQRSRSSRRRSKSRSSSQPNTTTDQSVASAYSQRSDYTSETGYVMVGL